MMRLQSLCASKKFSWPPKNSPDKIQTKVWFVWQRLVGNKADSPTPVSSTFIKKLSLFFSSLDQKVVGEEIQRRQCRHQIVPILYSTNANGACAESAAATSRRSHCCQFPNMGIASHLLSIFGKCMVFSSRVRDVRILTHETGATRVFNPWLFYNRQSLRIKNALGKNW